MRLTDDDEGHAQWGPEMMDKQARSRKKEEDEILRWDGHQRFQLSKLQATQSNKSHLLASQTP
jgi:hypothetical protein